MRLPAFVCLSVCLLARLLKNGEAYHSNSWVSCCFDLVSQTMAIPSLSVSFWSYILYCRIT